MSWSLETSVGFESDKIKFEVLPYLARGGIDVGCGARKVWPHLIGIDNQVDSRLFGTDMKPDIVVGNAARLALFADGAIDNVFSSHLLEHIEDWQAALREWWRVLKVGGNLILYLPHADLYPNIGEPGANPDHKHDFRPENIADFFSAELPDWTLCENQTRSAGNEYSFLQVWRKEPAGAGHANIAGNRPPKTAGVVRVGAKGDALWASSPVALLKEQGYAVTVYVAHTGEEVLRHDPNIYRLVTLPDAVCTDDELLAFWAHEAGKHDVWINLIGSVEQRLLYHPSSNEFFLPHRLRHQFGNRNYLETIHDYAGLPYDFRQRFYPTDDEMRLAHALRERLPAGPLVVLNPCGSGPSKTWPHAQRFLELMAAAGVNVLTLGDLKLPLEEVSERTPIVGTEWPVRLALTVAQLADVVVATESMIANAVAMAPMLKVMLLSHSSPENLTKHWRNTAALEAQAVACHPCHRIHPGDLRFCSRDTASGGSACMASYTAGTVADFVLEYLRPGLEQAA